MTTPGPMPGPCAWTLDTTCCTGWDDFTPEVQARATDLATFILDALTGRQFSQCPVNYRPCGPKCVGGGGYMTWPVSLGTVGGGTMPWMIPYVDGGLWRNCACPGDRKSTRLNSSHGYISYAVFCLKKKNKIQKKSILVHIKYTNKPRC